MTFTGCCTHLAWQTSQWAMCYCRSCCTPSSQEFWASERRCLTAADHLCLRFNFYEQHCFCLNQSSVNSYQLSVHSYTRGLDRTNSSASSLWGTSVRSASGRAKNRHVNQKSLYSIPAHLAISGQPRFPQKQQKPWARNHANVVKISPSPFYIQSGSRSQLIVWPCLSQVLLLHTKFP